MWESRVDASRIPANRTGFAAKWHSAQVAIRLLDLGPVYYWGENKAAQDATASSKVALETVVSGKPR